MFSACVSLDHQNFSSNPIWWKFEYFNFNLDPLNEFYKALEAHFDYLYQNYITFNFIEKKEADLTALLI